MAIPIYLSEMMSRCLSRVWAILLRRSFRLLVLIARCGVTSYESWSLDEMLVKQHPLLAEKNCRTLVVCTRNPEGPYRPHKRRRHRPEHRLRHDADSVE